MREIQAPKGVSEYFPPRSQNFEYVRETLITSAKLAGYQLMELPVFEDTELFKRGVGESTDVVSKEMYTFEDRGGRSITLRPEGTAGVMRSVIQYNLDKLSLPLKLWYSGAFFRAERPQAGRYRQFYQVGIEAIGSSSPELDVEVISVADSAFKKLGITYRLDITSLGDSQSRSAHRKDLVAFIAKLDLDDATRQRADINPLRLFDDKREEIKEKMQEAPLLLDYLSAESAASFSKVKELLTMLGIDFVVNPRMVRGLDYYTGTTFEFVSEKLGAQSGIGGGGRYDGLMQELGGSDISGIGFGIGVDRVLLACEAEGILSDDGSGASLEVFLIALGDNNKDQVIQLLNQLRNQGISADMEYGDRALKGAMKAADKSGAKYSAVLGDGEVASGVLQLKDMKTGIVKEVRISDLVNEFTKR
ncbi:MAG: histidine--tRNA ligase [Actinobacteria bacterium]|jgi:histidyl-tRNA synthetase|nr:histidine--tRNA ligase [Actinomycetota bacterium]